MINDSELHTKNQATQINERNKNYFRGNIIYFTIERRPLFFVQWITHFWLHKFVWKYSCDTRNGNKNNNIRKMIRNQYYLCLLDSRCAQYLFRVPPRILARFVGNKDNIWKIGVWEYFTFRKRMSISQIFTGINAASVRTAPSWRSRDHGSSLRDVSRGAYHRTREYTATHRGFLSIIERMRPFGNCPQLTARHVRFESCWNTAEK